MVINMKECVLVTKGLVKEKSKDVVNFYFNKLFDNSINLCYNTIKN